MLDGICSNLLERRERTRQSKVIVILASEAASYVTGTSINIDGGSGPSL